MPKEVKELQKMHQRVRPTIWSQKNCWSKWENHWSRFQTFNLSKAFDVITNSPYCCPSVLVLVLVLAYSLGINLTMVAVVTSWNI